MFFFIYKLTVSNTDFTFWMIFLHLGMLSLKSLAIANKSSWVGVPLPLTVISCSDLCGRLVISYAGERQ